MTDRGLKRLKEPLRQVQKEIVGLLGLLQRGGPGSGHHGHAGRPGEVGGSLPGKGTGLGEFDFGSPSARNEIRFKISMAEALRKGLNQGEINLLGVEFHQQVIKSLRDMESTIGFPISGLVISNDLLDMAVAAYGEMVLDNPNYREDAFGKLRGESSSWRGAYVERMVWLDETINTIMGPIKMDSPAWRESVWHEVGHYITSWDAGFSYPFNVMMEYEHDAFYPSVGYLSWVHESYGFDVATIAGEYKADLVAAWVGSQLDGKPPKWRRKFTGLQGDLVPEDMANMGKLMGLVMKEGKEKHSLIERQIAEEESHVLVLFPVTGEIVPVKVSSLYQLPPRAIILDQIFEN